MVSVPGNHDHHHHHSNYKGYSHFPGPVALPAHAGGERAMFQLLSRHRGQNSEQDSTVLTHTGPRAWIRCYLRPGTSPQLMLPPYRREEGIPASIPAPRQHQGNPTPCHQIIHCQVASGCGQSHMACSILGGESGETVEMTDTVAGA